MTGRTKRALAVVLAILLAGAGIGAWWWTDRDGGAAEPGARPPAHVVVAEVGTARIVRGIQGVGTLRATESVMVTAETTGRLVEILFEDGAAVLAGAPLFRLEQDTALAELQAAEAEVVELRQQLERAMQLAQGGFGPRAEAEDLRPRLIAAEARAGLTRTRLRQLTITAPFAGRLGLRQVSPGALVQPGTELVALDAIDPIELRFSLPEREIGRIAAGQPVSASGAALAQGEPVEGLVRVVAPRVDPMLRTVEVAARLPNPEGRLVPGMLMRVRLGAEVVEDAVVVPPTAVQPQGPDQFAFRVRDGRAERVSVRIGSRTPDRLEILEGLAPGELVVVEGMGLSDGQPVQARRVDAPEPAATAEAAPRQGATLR